MLKPRRNDRGGKLQANNTNRIRSSSWVIVLAIVLCLRVGAKSERVVHKRNQHVLIYVLLVGATWKIFQSYIGNFVGGQENYGSVGWKHNGLLAG